MRRRFAEAGLLVVSLIAAGCGTVSYGANSSGLTSSDRALERADNILEMTQHAGGARQTELTPQDFAALTKARGFTSAVAAEVVSRARVEAAANRRTVGRADAATREAQKADNMLVLAAAEQQAGGHVENGTLALGLDEIATHEITYEKRLQQQAVLSEHLAPLFMTAEAALRAWEHQARKRGFPTQKAAKADYERRVNRPLAIGLRLLGNDSLLQRQTARARRSLRNSIRNLAFVLRWDSTARREARHLIRADPQGFLASAPKAKG